MMRYSRGIALVATAALAACSAPQTTGNASAGDTGNTTAAPANASTVAAATDTELDNRLKALAAETTEPKAKAVVLNLIKTRSSERKRDFLGGEILLPSKPLLGLAEDDKPKCKVVVHCHALPSFLGGDSDFDFCWTSETNC